MEAGKTNRQGRWRNDALDLDVYKRQAFYILTLSAGYICLLMGGVWMSRLLKNNLMNDPFNNENESFQQETRLIENEYSINLPTKFYYNKQWNNGFANVVNPQRADVYKRQVPSSVGKSCLLKINPLFNHLRSKTLSIVILSSNHS